MDQTSASAPSNEASPSAAAPTITTRAQRAAAIKAEADSPPQATVDAADASSPATTAPATEPDSVAEGARAKAAADRAARIEAMRAREREKQDKRKAHRASRAEQEELAQLRQMKAAWEKNDEAFKDEEAFLAEAERRGIGAEKVIAYFRDRMTNPEAIAERRANAAKSELQKDLEEIRNELKKRDERDEQVRQQAEFRQKTVEAAQNFIAIAEAKAEDAPLTAAMYQKHGRDVVIGFANRFIVPLMPEGFDIENPEHLDVLHDHMEQFLAETQLTASTPPANSTPDTSSKAAAGKKNGEKPITTLSNRIVSERGTVTESIPLAKMSLEERRRFLKEKYEREDQ